MPDLVGGAIVGTTTPPRASRRDDSEAVVVEVEQVVRRRDEPPFASAGRPTAALEAFDRAVELDLAEDGLDRDLAATVERAALGRGQGAAHEVVAPAGPAGPGVFAQPGVGRDQHGHAVADDLFHLAL